ncbi:MAG TPA: hypothetical protein VF188_09055 [Longimicrobiales bacterium]
MTTTLEWRRAGDELPTPDRDVLVILPAYDRPTVELCRFAKGDPTQAGEFYQQDRWWPLDSMGVSQAVQPDHVWAYAPLAETVLAEVAREAVRP